MLSVRWIWVLCGLCLSAWTCTSPNEALAHSGQDNPIQLAPTLSTQSTTSARRDTPILRDRRWFSQIQSEPLRQDNANPPMEWPLILLQGFSGAVVASFGSVLFQSIVDISVQESNRNASITDRQVLAGNIGTPLIMATLPWFVALTVWSIGKLSNNYYGNFWWTLLGAYAGQLVVFGTSLLLSALDTTPDRAISRITSYILNGLLAGLGAVIFYNIFRKPHKGIQQLGSLLQFHDGRWAWGVPLPQLTVRDNEQGVTIPLFQGQF